MFSKILAGLVLLVLSGATTALPQNEPPRSQLNLAQDQWDLPATNGQRYSITVTRHGAAPTKGYPVLYVLDGNAYGPLLAAEAQLEAGHAIETSYLLVAVGYTTDQLFNTRRRQFDFTTPWSDNASAQREHIDPTQTGGADAFAKFLVSTLRTEVTRRYPIDPTRQAIFGHSLGGLFVLHLLFTSPQSFQHFIAASPSSWWDEGSILKQAAVFEHSHPEGASLLISVGEYEQKLSPNEADKPYAAQRLARLQQRKMVSSATLLADLLHVRLLIVPEADHIGSVAEAGRHALHIAFAEQINSKQQPEHP